MERSIEEDMMTEIVPDLATELAASQNASALTQMSDQEGHGGEAERNE